MTPKDGTTKKRKGVKARRWRVIKETFSLIGGENTALLGDKGPCRTLCTLDVSDEAALIEQCARALHGGSWTYDVGEEFTRDSYRDDARAVLESLGIIKKARK